MKAVNFLDLTLNLTTAKYKPFNKPDNNPVYINILSNHTPNMSESLQSNISKRIDNLSATTFNKSKYLCNIALVKSGFKYKIIFQQQKLKKNYGLAHHTVLMFQQLLVKNSSAY